MSTKNDSETDLKQAVDSGDVVVEKNPGLPKPYYQDEHVTLYYGDCRELLPLMPKVDLVLTDPPYGIGISNNPVRQKHERKDWDNAPVDNGLLQLVIQAGTVAIVWGGNYFGLPAQQCFYVWDKQQPEDFSLAMCEMAWTNNKGPAKLFRKSVLSYSKEHPTQKPVSLMTWCIGKVPNTKTVLDPFAGSGTTLRAAKDLGLSCVGIELEEKYCEIAANRMRQEVLGL
jgi:DNA modification methylase